MPTALENKLHNLTQTHFDVGANMRSVIPDLGQPNSIDLLSQRGVALRRHETFFSIKPKKVEFEASVQKLVDVVNCLVQENPSLSPELISRIHESAKNTTDCMLRLIFEPPVGMDICRRKPLTELSQLIQLLFAAQMRQSPLHIAVPVCPDVREGYKVGDEVGDVIEKALKYIEVFSPLLKQYHFHPFFELHVADVEAYDPAILRKSGETTESYLGKVQVTLGKTEQLIGVKGIDDACIIPMSEVFQREGKQYDYLQRLAIDIMRTSSRKNVVSTIQGLMKERVKEKDFQGTDEDQQRELVLGELGGYAAYGSVISGNAILMSPDAMSAIPAYQFLIDSDDAQNAVIYVK